jgi:2-polyprenyl-3-methyl-5-hydroxy-6-metoxy-1,4-benzoquinol methylase
VSGATSDDRAQQTRSLPAAEEPYRYVLASLARAAPPPADLIELGAATGVRSIALARVGYRVTAVDLGKAPDAWGGQAEGVIRAALVEADVAFVHWNLEQTPYPFDNVSFDVVLPTEVLDHLRDHPLSTLLEARRLRAGGLLLLTTPNSARLQNRLRLALGRSVYAPLGDWMFGVPHARHVRKYSASESCELATRARPRPVSLRDRHFHILSGRQDGTSVALERALDQVGLVCPSLGSGLVLVARRDVADG